VTSSLTEERSSTPLHVKIDQMLTEARVVLPGAQALFGFQLAIVMTQSFVQLSSASKIVHEASLFMVGLSVVLLIAPAPPITGLSTPARTRRTCTGSAAR